MAHPEQKEFFAGVKANNPSHFNKVRVIDCGSLDVNGTLQDLFTDSVYIGVDIVAGNNVDIVRPIKDLDFVESFDTVVSGEMLEHDESWKESIQKMYDMCKSGGLVALSCAGKNRAEHGTLRTGAIWGTSDNYYKNLEPVDIQSILKPSMFSQSETTERPDGQDTYFWGIKK